MIHLDNNATTRPAPEVVAAITAALTITWHNPSSIHRAGQEARRAVELARVELAALIGAKPKSLTFTSGGTEAIDLAIRGTLLARPGRRAVVSTPLEHAAIRDLLAELANRGAIELRLAPVTREGLVEPAAIAPLIDERVALVSVQWCNNETGGVQPVAEIGALARASGAVFHCDATQWVGKMPASVGETGVPDTAGSPGVAATPAFWCDLLTFSPHKFHGPKGVGVLWMRPGSRLAPTILGAQERGRRGGTENVPGIVGAGAAARLAAAFVADADEIARLAALRDRFEAAVLAACPGAHVNGPRDRARRIWNTTNIAFPPLEAEALLLMLSERGVAASAGAACSSGSLEPSPVLLAMGVPRPSAHGSLRFSISRETSESEVNDAARIVAECVGQLRRAIAGSGD